MSKAMQLMGSKISLVSKSEIRYEGTLFTLNPNESTLALAKVRMFGTENRPTDNPVAARDEVFEFIIFRGQDIKDIRLCEAPQPTMPGGLPYDPAIVQHSVPGAGAMGGAGLQQPSGIMRPNFGPMGGMNPYPNLVDGAAPGGLGQLGNLMTPGGLAAGLGSLAGGLGGLSGAAAVAAAASELPNSPRGDLPPHPDQDLLSGVAARSTNSTPVGGASGTSQSRKSPSGKNNDDDGNQRTSSRGSGGNQDRDNNRSRQNDSRRDGNRDQQQRGGNRDSGRSNSRGRSSRGGNGGNNGGNGRGAGPTGQQGSFSRFASNFSGGNRGGKGALKFDEDYDFESANTKFEELKSKMGKMKIGGDTVLVLSSAPEDKPSAETESGDVVTPTADGEASTEALVSTGTDEGNAKTPDTPEKPKCYDKTSSFFDSISCEAVERSKGNTQRTDWRQERKLNAETFGLPYNQRRGGNGGYINRGGRGYYNNRGGNGGYYRQNSGGDGGYGQQSSRDGGYGQQPSRDGGYGHQPSRDGGSGGYQNSNRGGGNYQNDRDGGFQSRSGGGRSGGGGGYRGGRGNRGYNSHRDGLGENVGQPRGGYNSRRNWQQQENRA